MEGASFPGPWAEPDEPDVLGSCVSQHVFRVLPCPKQGEEDPLLRAVWLALTAPGAAARESAEAARLLGRLARGLSLGRAEAGRPLLGALASLLRRRLEVWAPSSEAAGGWAPGPARLFLRQQALPAAARALAEPLRLLQRGEHFDVLLTLAEDPAEREELGPAPPAPAELGPDLLRSLAPSLAGEIGEELGRLDRLLREATGGQWVAPAELEQEPFEPSLSSAELEGPGALQAAFGPELFGAALETEASPEPAALLSLDGLAAPLDWALQLEAGQPLPPLPFAGALPPGRFASADPFGTLPQFAPGALVFEGGPPQLARLPQPLQQLMAQHHQTPQQQLLPQPQQLIFRFDARFSDYAEEGEPALATTDEEGLSPHHRPPCASPVSPVALPEAANPRATPATPGLFPEEGPVVPALWSGPVKFVAPPPDLLPCPPSSPEEEGPALLFEGLPAYEGLRFEGLRPEAEEPVPDEPSQGSPKRARLAEKAGEAPAAASAPLEGRLCSQCRVPLTEENLRPSNGAVIRRHGMNRCIDCRQGTHTERRELERLRNNLMYRQPEGQRSSKRIRQLKAVEPELELCEPRARAPAQRKKRSHGERKN